MSIVTTKNRASGLAPLVGQSPRHLFFTGQGGVGKTSIASAVAIALADLGRRVLIVSTDPASNLDEVFETKLSNHPTPVNNIPGLWGLNLDPHQAAAEYREKMVGPYRGILPESAISSIEEQFSGACTVEIAAFDQFAQLLGDKQTTSDFDHVIFDTAPTGHTLRLLALPSSWASYLDANTTGTTCIGPLAGLATQQKLYHATAQALCDHQLTTLVLVTRPERSAIREAARTSQELKALGVEQQWLVINGLFEATSTDPLAVAMEQRMQAALAALPDDLKKLPSITIPFQPGGLIGKTAIQHLGHSVETVTNSQPASMQQALTSAQEFPPWRSLLELTGELAQMEHGVIMTMGKGGVGKTTIAAAIAIRLAHLGRKVLLTTTDPAGHIVGLVETGELPQLSVERIDAHAETERYRDEVRQTAGIQLDDAGRALLEEDLRSPCTEEIAVFRAFARTVAQGKQQIVVLDTAPTGHTILLLDAAMAFHQEAQRLTNQVSVDVAQLLPVLRDPQQTRILLVTLPEATPVHEARLLQADLERAGMEPMGWVVNQSLSLLDVHDPGLVTRKSFECKYITEVAQAHPSMMTIVPWQATIPTGAAGLLSMTESRGNSLPSSGVSQ